MSAALLHKSADVRTSPYPRTDLSRDLCDGDAEGGEAVQDGNTDLEFRNLTVEVPRHALPPSRACSHALPGNG